MATRKTTGTPPRPAGKPTLAPKPENLAPLVLLLRGERVLLDADLAALYGVQTGALNQAVKRNLDRFPEDFMFQLSAGEAQAVARSRSQTVILKRGRNLKDAIKKLIADDDSRKAAPKRRIGFLG